MTNIFEPGELLSGYKKIIRNNFKKFMFQVENNTSNMIIYEKNENTFMNIQI